MALIYYSGSRTGIIAFAVISIILKPLLILPLLAISSSFIIPILDSSKRFNWILNFNGLTSLMEIPQFKIRIDILLSSINLLLEKPFFGYFQTPVGITDNFFLMFVLRYGIVTFIIMTIIILFFINKLNLTFRQIYSFSATFVLFGLTGSFMNNFRLFFFYFLFLIISIKVENAKKHY